MVERTMSGHFSSGIVGDSIPAEGVQADAGWAL